jgi:hypothetical protein
VSFHAVRTHCEFSQLIGAQLEETSLGLHSVHHVHNIDCGIANILSLLEPNNEVGHKADQLSLKASSYISRHDLASARVSDGDGNEDADRFRAAQAALAGFRFAVERSRRCLLSPPAHGSACLSWSNLLRGKAQARQIGAHDDVAGEPARLGSLPEIGRSQRTTGHLVGALKHCPD